MFKTVLLLLNLGCWFVMPVQTLLAAPLSVVVSILPQKYFVERIGGSQVAVSVLVGPGQSPETYEPTSKQLATFSTAQLYVRIGMPFETRWLAQWQANNPKLRVLDAREGIRLRTLDHHSHEDGHVHEAGQPDPHIWLSPPLVQQMALGIRDALTALDPTHSAAYQQNYTAFVADLVALDAEIRTQLAPLTPRTFLIFHPSWGYFAEQYGLQQVPIEQDGKEPGARSLVTLLEQARALGSKTIFVQAQHSRSQAASLAAALGAELVTIDSLADDYLDNLRRTASQFARRLGAERAP